MNLTRGLILAALLVVAAALWYFMQPASIETAPGAASTGTALRESSPAPLPDAPAPGSQPPPRLEPVPSSPASSIPPPSRLAMPRIASATSPIGKQNPPAAEAEAVQTDLDRVRYMLRDYRSIAGENPVGTNAEIMKALMGVKKKGAQLGPPEGQQLNGEGELVDRWGTPYFFHQLSKSDMEIRSAGPDRVMWTADDQDTK
jgi:hypothetical protein